MGQIEAQRSEVVSPSTDQASCTELGRPASDIEETERVAPGIDPPRLKGFWASQNLRYNFRVCPILRGHLSRNTSAPTYTYRVHSILPGSRQWVLTFHH